MDWFTPTKDKNDAQPIQHISSNIFQKWQCVICVTSVCLRSRSLIIWTSVIKHNIFDIHLLLENHFLRIRGRPRNRSSRHLTIDPRQISINSIDRSTFGLSHDSALLSATAIDSIDLTDFILDSLYLPRFLADRTNGRAYATVVLRPSPSFVIVVSELWINDAS